MSTEPTTTVLAVPQPPPYRPPEELPTDLFDAELRVLSSIDTTTGNGAFLLSRVLNATAMRKEAWPQKRFIVRDVVLHTVKVPSKASGQVEQRIRTVLVGPNGELAGFQSIGVIGSLRNLFAQFGKPPWEPALILEWDQQPAAVGHVAKLFAVGRVE